MIDDKNAVILELCYMSCLAAKTGMERGQLDPADIQFPKLNTLEFGLIVLALNMLRCSPAVELKSDVEALMFKLHEESDDPSGAADESRRMKREREGTRGE